MVITHHLRKSSILFLKIISPIYIYFFSLAIVCTYKLQNNLFPFSFLFQYSTFFPYERNSTPYSTRVYEFLLKTSMKKKKSNFINFPRREDSSRHLYKIIIYIYTKWKKLFQLNYNLTHHTFTPFMKNIYSHFARNIKYLEYHPTSISNIPTHVNNLR